MPQIQTTRPAFAAATTASLFALVVLALAAHDASVGADGDAFLVAGIVVSVGLAVAFPRRGRSRDGAAWLTIATLVTLVAAAGIYAAEALPDDLHLRTLGRPPGLWTALVAVLAAIVIVSVRAVDRCEPAGRAGLFLVIPLVTLEGRALAVPPAFALAAVGILLVANPTPRPAPRVAALGSIALVVASFTLSTLLGADPDPGVDVLVRILGLAGAFLLIAGDADPRAAATRAIRTLLVTVAVSAGVAFYVRFLLWRHVGPLGVDVWGTELSLFGRHPNVVAPWFGAAVVLAIALLRHGPRDMRPYCLITLPMAATCLLATASRLAIGATLVFASLAIAERVRSRRTLLYGALVLALAAGAAASIPALRDKLLNKAQHANILGESHRIQRMKVAWATGLDRPIVGQGPRCWFRQGAFVPPSRLEGVNTADHPHNLPLALFESTGVIGLVAVAFLLGAAFLVYRRGITSPDRDVSGLTRAVAFALATQLLTNTMDLGDAIDTLLPSRLLVDLGILVALSRAAGGSGGLPTPAAFRASVGIGGVAVAAVLLLGRGFERRGTEVMRRGDYPRAIDLLERAARLLPFSQGVRIQLIALGFETRDARLSRVYLREAEELAPDRPTLHETRARLLLGLGNPRAAMIAAEQVLELDPYGPDGIRLAPLLAELRLANGDRNGALEALARAARNDYRALEPFIANDKPNVLRLGRSEVTLAELIAVLDHDVESDASDRARRRVPLRECDMHILFGNYDEAREALERMREIDGHESINYHQFHGRIGLASGDYEAGIAAVDRAIEMIDNPTLLLDKGNLLRAMGRRDEALDSYRAALALSFDAHFAEETYLSVLTEMAVVLAELGRHEERCAVLRQCAFFQTNDLARASIWLDVAETLPAIGEDPRPPLARALRLVLAAPNTDEARAAADRLGRLCAASRRVGEAASALADDLERTAARRGGGAVLHRFRVALLDALSLDARAENARRDLAPFE